MSIRRPLVFFLPACMPAVRGCDVSLGPHLSVICLNVVHFEETIYRICKNLWLDELISGWRLKKNSSL